MPLINIARGFQPERPQKKKSRKRASHKPKMNDKARESKEELEEKIKTEEKSEGSTDSKAISNINRSLEQISSIFRSLKRAEKAKVIDILGDPAKWIGVGYLIKNMGGEVYEEYKPNFSETIIDEKENKAYMYLTSLYYAGSHRYPTPAVVYPPKGKNIRDFIFDAVLRSVVWDTKSFYEFGSIELFPPIHSVVSAYILSETKSKPLAELVKKLSMDVSGKALSDAYIIEDKNKISIRFMSRDRRSMFEVEIPKSTLSNKAKKLVELVPKYDSLATEIKLSALFSAKTKSGFRDFLKYTADLLDSLWKKHNKGNIWITFDFDSGSISVRQGNRKARVFKNAIEKVDGGGKVRIFVSDGINEELIKFFLSAKNISIGTLNDKDNIFRGTTPLLVEGEVDGYKIRGLFIPS